MIQQSLSKTAFVDMMWDKVMTIKPIHNTEKEKITKLKADLKAHFRTSKVNQCRLVADELYLKKI